ncbi:hypothetical protein W04_0541 [Pseudoalteromonas sp. SW0106-04]|uniref:DUF3630 family protein n=1 Tax=Pseudoalteromonas sp. SW0106-04 TaxID=1702169 RepID=UPI0006B5CB6D|nr:DUF3630 family protein [Pseudoalteromonas sp. SW0106-04]GAP74030.1 hypothetical protein W04_0541 [Pseudoalteromonas sp. SW0106-04]
MTQLAIDSQHHVIIITPDVMPSADEFDFWGRIFLHHDAIDIGEFEQGVDRHMLRFSFELLPFELHFEHYGDNIWISATGVEAQGKLTELGNYLSAS